MLFFFFKQKTAYEMRISDWSADVCSSDLERNVRADQPPLWLLHAEDDGVVKIENSVRLREATRAVGAACEAHFFERGGHGFGLMKTAGLPVAKIGRASVRERVCQYV